MRLNDEFENDLERRAGCITGARRRRGNGKLPPLTVNVHDFLPEGPQRNQFKQVPNG